MSLVEDPRPSLKTVSSPIKSANLGSQAYVLSLVALSDFYAASASAPSNAIHLFDKSSLRCSQALSGHAMATTYLRKVDRLANISQQMLVSSSKDGTVKVWDERNGSVALQMTGSGETRALLCCDVSPDGQTVVAGTDLQGDDALVLYWDPRQPAALLRKHSSTHSDDITAVHFLSDGSSIPNRILLSASSDGLICTSNPDEDDEDESVLHVGNWSCSVSQAGWTQGLNGPQVWAASDMETFSTWSNELDLIYDVDIRSPSIHSQELTWVTDYLISGHRNPMSTSPDLQIFVGSNEGDVALISKSDYSQKNSPWLLHRTWSAGHQGIVRSVLWDESNNILLTGGEDSKINVWPSPPLSSNMSIVDPAFANNSMDVDQDTVVYPTSRKREIDWGRPSRDTEVKVEKKARWT